jgi:hypothetical protein
VERLPPVLAERLDHADIRAIYDLFRVWEKDQAGVEAALPAADVFLTITEARRIIEGVTGKSSSSVFLAPRGREPEPGAAPMPANEPEAASKPTTIEDTAEAVLPVPVQEKPRPVTEPVTAPPAVPIPQPAAKPQRPRFVMETADGRRGVLVTDRRAAEAGSVLLEIEGSGTAEVTFSELRPVEVA